MVRCNWCYWEGEEDDLKLVNESSKIDEEDDTLYWIKVCPNCGYEDYLMDIEDD